MDAVFQLPFVNIRPNNAVANSPRFTTTYVAYHPVHATATSVEDRMPTVCQQVNGTLFKS